MVWCLAGGLDHRTRLVERIGGKGTHCARARTLLMLRPSACVCACVCARAAVAARTHREYAVTPFLYPEKAAPSHCLTKQDRPGRIALHTRRYNTSRSLADCTSLHVLPVRASSLGCGHDIPARIDRVSADPEVQGCRVLVLPSIDGRPAGEGGI